MEAQGNPVREGESQRWPGALQWHSEVQRRWGLCTLNFWLLRFHDWYEREQTFDRLVELMEEIGVGSYATYELSGQFDVLLRAWVPDRRINGFAKRLKETFPLQDIRQFTVADIVRHWPWAAADTHIPKACDLEALAASTSLEEVEAANRLSDQGHMGAAGYVLPGDAEVLERLMGSGAITDLGSTTGIRMFIRLKAKEGLDDYDWGKLTSFTATTLDRLMRVSGEKGDRGARSFALDDVSLYACNDRSLLILCRIPYHSWHDLREQLLEPLAGRGGVAQTTTLPALSRNFVRSRDRLIVDDRAKPALVDSSGSDGPDGGDGGSTPPLPPAPQVPPGVREYLERPEDRDFEAKGSAFTPLERWLRLNKDAPEEDALPESTGFFRDTIGKTVVAMLNSEGGALLIGVLECDKFTQHSSRLLERIAELPVAGRYYVLGLQDPVFRKRDWDGFELKFNRLLKECIEGEISDLVRISRDWHKGRPLALVQVRYPGMTNGFYLRGEGETQHFYVRRGGSSDELHGTKALEYIERARRRAAEEDQES